MQLRHRLHVEFAARPLHQRPGPRRNCSDHRLGQGPRRPAQAARTASTTCASPPTCGRRTSSTTSTSPSSITPPTRRSTSMSASSSRRPTPQLYLTKPPRPVARAVDDHGDDVTDVVRAHRRPLPRHLRPRQIPGRRARTTTSRWTSATTPRRRGRCICWPPAGFTRPTAPSTSPSSRAAATGRTASSWKCPTARAAGTVGRPALGFPAGKNKTIVIRLDGIPGQEGVARRFRLRTNMEIYWDALEYAEGLDAGLARQTILAPETAELRHRGISRITRADASSPELPDYDKLVTSRRSTGATSSAGTPVTATCASCWKRSTTATSS